MLRTKLAYYTIYKLAPKPFRNLWESGCKDLSSGQHRPCIALLFWLTCVINYKCSDYLHLCFCQIQTVLHFHQQSDMGPCLYRFYLPYTSFCLSNSSCLSRHFLVTPNIITEISTMQQI